MLFYNKTTGFLKNINVYIDQTIAML